MQPPSRIVAPGRLNANGGHEVAIQDLEGALERPAGISDPGGTTLVVPRPEATTSAWPPDASTADSADQRPLMPRLARSCPMSGRLRLSLKERLKLVESRSGVRAMA